MLFKGPGWTPGKPRLGDPADLPEVFSHVASLVCKLQWQDNTFEQENKNVWLKTRSNLCLVHCFLHLDMLHLLFNVNRFSLALYKAEQRFILLACYF